VALIGRNRSPEVKALGWDLFHRNLGQILGSKRLRRLVEANGAVETEHHRSFDGVLQLTDIARPAVLHQGIHGLGGKTLDVTLVLYRIHLEKVSRKQRDVFPAISQWGHLDSNDVEAVIEILAKTTHLDLGAQIHVGGSDDPDIHRLGTDPANLTDLALLDDPQQLGLGL